MVCGHCYGLHPGRTETVDGSSRRCLGKPGEKRRIASDVGSAVRDITHQAIIDKVTFHTRFGDRMFDRMRRHRHRRRDVEAAATRLGEPGTGIRYDDSFTHFEFSIGVQSRDFD